MDIIRMERQAVEKARDYGIDAFTAEHHDRHGA